MPGIANYSDGKYYIADGVEGVIVGQTDVMRGLFAIINHLAGLRTTVLVQGETGTGKELVAKALHYNSPERNGGKFVAVNCAGIPESLLESTLFGHVKGAFTDAYKDRRGMAKEADGGTLFLDEIGEMSPNLQAKILRLAQNGEITPVGSNLQEHVDVRLVAASHRNLEAMVRQHRFREDLFYRLNVFPLAIPPLRERAEDIPLIVNYLIEEKNARYRKKVRGIDTDAIAWMAMRPWNGNVRELDNVVERCFVLCKDGSTISLADLTEPPAKRLLSTVESSEDVRTASMEQSWYQAGFVILTPGHLARIEGAFGYTSIRRIIASKAYVQKVSLRSGCQDSLVFFTLDNVAEFFRHQYSPAYNELLVKIRYNGVMHLGETPFRMFSASEVREVVPHKRWENRVRVAIDRSPYAVAVGNRKLFSITPAMVRDFFQNDVGSPESKKMLDMIHRDYAAFKAWKPAA